MKNRILFFIISSIMFFLAAFRDGIGYDYSGYESIYTIINNSLENWPLVSVEYGYFLINVLSHNFHIVIFISACLGV
ncbi:EpsG family protein, partial [Lachnoclostridium sp.]|uniref:EpsG family protein n=1 Tax=Lachnoclostridium sp. TaxID=2028282 RepID=UPI002899B2FF